MALEALPERGALWLTNWVLDATIATFTSERNNYEAEHLLSPLRSETWRSTDSTSDTYAVLDMGQIRTPTAFALGDINYSAGTFVRLRGSDDSAQVINPVWWDIPLYAVDAVGKIGRWYPGTTPTGGSIGSSTNPADAASARGRQFWAARILPATFGSYGALNDDGDAADYFETGLLWLGPYTAIAPWEGLRSKPKNQSNRTKSRGLATWTDPLPVQRNKDVDVGGLTMAEYYTLEAAILAQGSTHAIIDMYGFSTDPILKRGGCYYGMFSDSPVSGDIGSVENNSLSFSFEEASG